MNNFHEAIDLIYANPESHVNEMMAASFFIAYKEVNEMVNEKIANRFYNHIGIHPSNQDSIVSLIKNQLNINYE